MSEANGNESHKTFRECLKDWDDFRVANIGTKHDLWEVQGCRDGEWFDLYDDPDRALAEATAIWLKKNKLAKGSAIDEN